MRNHPKCLVLRMSELKALLVQVCPAVPREGVRDAASRVGSKGCQSGSQQFAVLILLLPIFTAEVLSEEPILKWYKDAHLAKGKSVFLEQMKKFVEWLKNAEEGNQQLSS